MIITVVGLGKIGLPLAVQFARKGHTVLGVDTNENTVQLINSGHVPFPGEEHLAEYLAETIKSGKLKASTDTSKAVSQSDVIVVVVPLFVDENGQPDFGWMDSATDKIAKGLKPGTLIAYETTLPVGTTRTRFGPALESVSGLTAGIDFHLVFSPERVSTGRVFTDLRKYPKIIGGINEESAVRGIKFYEEVLDFDYRHDLDRANGVWNLGSCDASELVKLAETTYRDVNIALANQFALFAEKNEIDIHEVIAAANSQTFSHLHQPGIAVGGHCIPVYPHFYLWNDPNASVVRVARSTNESMPEQVVTTLALIHGPLTGQRVVVLGVSYRGGVKESAFSGVFPTVSALKARGAEVLVHDPMFSDAELIALGFIPFHFETPVDAAILQTDHNEYKNLKSIYFPNLRTFLDGRGVAKGIDWPGVRYHALGKPLTSLTL